MLRVVNLEWKLLCMRWHIKDAQGCEFRMKVIAHNVTFKGCSGLSTQNNENNCVWGDM